MDSPFSPRDLERLKGVHPELVRRLGMVFAAMREIHAMFVTDGFRTLAQQQALYAKGRTAPGPRVTDADGIQNVSNHQRGLAVDCAFLASDPWASDLPWARYGAAAKAVGLHWGGDWKYPDRPDRPHVELPELA